MGTDDNDPKKPRKSAKKVSARRAVKRPAARKSAAEKAGKASTKRSSAKKATAKKLPKNSKKSTATKPKKSAATSRERSASGFTEHDESAPSDSKTTSQRATKPQSGRPRRKAPQSTAEAGAIVVTGICGRLGNLLARRLHRSHRVVGIDRRPFPNRPKDIVHHAIDLRRKTTRDVFRRGDVKAVVHLGVLHNPRASELDKHKWNVVAFQKLLDYVAQYEVPKLVVVSSANVYGSQPDNPQFLTEDAPLLGAQRFGGMRDLVEMDMLAQSFFWKRPETETVILRPCHIPGRCSKRTEQLPSG